jgi:heavy metal sensor kinase
MLVRSFQAKFALLAVLLAGLVLAGFAVLAMRTISRLGLERVDRELLALGDPQVRRPQPPEHWPHFDRSLAVLYGDDQADQYVICVTDPALHPVYAAARWPAGVKLADLGVAERHVTPLPLPQFRPPPDAAPGGRPGLRPPPRPDEPELREPFPGAPRGPGGNPQAGPPLRPEPPRFVTQAAAGRTWRFAVLGNDQVTLVIGTDLAGFQAEIRRFRNTCLVAAPAALLLLAAAGWLLALRALRPVKVIAHVTGGITAAGLDRRVPVMAADREFRELIDVINGMLARIERSYRQATRFSADAAHELKTPLTILQGQLEQAVQAAPAGSLEQRTCAGLLEEVQRLKSIVRKLLLLAQADAGQLRLNRQRIDVGEMVQRAAEDLRDQAPDIRLQVAAEGGVFIDGDADLLGQALQNLLSNACKFNDDRKDIRIALHAAGGRARLTVANTGAGIPAAEQDRLFERFYRADQARNREVDGSGLGLSLAREIARAHGGDLVLDRSDAELTRFALTLPLAAESAR